VSKTKTLDSYDIGYGKPLRTLSFRRASLETPEAVPRNLWTSTKN